MASTYSTLKVELIGTGEQPGTWGTITNVNLGTTLEQAIVGRATATFSADSDLTLTLTDTNATQVARHYILNVISAVALTSTRNLIVPSINKPYIVENNTSGGQSIIVKTAIGTGVTIPNGLRTMVYADSVNVVPAESYKPALALGTALPVTSGGTGGSTSTGSGAVVLGTSPTISNAVLTGVPTVPTASEGTNTTQAASTAFVINQVAASTSGVSTFSAGTTGLTPSVNTSGAVTLGGTLGVFNGGTGVTTSTGSGSNVLSTSPVLTSPNLGTPSFLNLSNATNLSLETGVTGTLPSARGGTGVTTSTGSGSNVLSSSPVLTSPNLGTPSFLNLSNATNLSLATGVTGTLPSARGGTGVTTSTGSGSNVLSSSPVLTSPNLGTPSAINIQNATGITSAGIVTISDTQTISGTKTFSGNTTVSGNLGVGATNPVTSLWGGYAKSKSNANPAFVFDGGTGNQPICAGFMGGPTSGTGTTVLFAAFEYGGNPTGTRVPVGNIASTGTSLIIDNATVIAPSDYRLKEDVQDITNGLSIVKQLRPVTYKWKQDNKDGQGFIAHELQEVIPISVSGEKDQLHPDGRVKPQGIDYSSLIPTLTAAIQEQQALIESLTARVAALEAA